MVYCAKLESKLFGAISMIVQTGSASGKIMLVF
jgi:hypothetical protein